MAKRLFIAINLPEDIKDRVHREVEHHLRPALGKDIHFVKPENWHITLAFLGGQDEDNLDIIKQTVRKTAEQFKPPLISLDKIGYKSDMVWLFGSKKCSEHLTKLGKMLINTLKDRGINFKVEHWPLNVHVTLLRFGRIPKFPEPLPLIDKTVGINFSGASLDLMESTLNTPAGAQYHNLFSAPFTGKQIL